MSLKCGPGLERFFSFFFIYCCLKNEYFCKRGVCCLKNSPAPTKFNKMLKQKTAKRIDLEKKTVRQLQMLCCGEASKRCT